jgi:hypothetical protein
VTAAESLTAAVLLRQVTSYRRFYRSLDYEIISESGDNCELGPWDGRVGPLLGPVDAAPSKAGPDCGWVCGHRSTFDAYGAQEGPCGGSKSDECGPLRPPHRVDTGLTGISENRWLP